MKKIIYFAAAVLLTALLLAGCAKEEFTAATVQAGEHEEAETRSGDFPWTGTQVISLTGDYTGQTAKVTLNWSYTASPQPVIAWYEIRKITLTGADILWARIPGAITSYTINGVTAGEKFYVRGDRTLDTELYLSRYTVPSNIYTVPANTIPPYPAQLSMAVNTQINEIILQWHYLSGADTNWDRFQVWWVGNSGTDTLIAIQPASGGMGYVVNPAAIGSYYIICGRAVGNSVEYSEPSNILWYPGVPVP